MSAKTPSSEDVVPVIIYAHMVTLVEKLYCPWK